MNNEQVNNILCDSFAPLVSVVMSIYNVEEYLEEAIESLINQDLGFENNIQLILVNDGSSDSSASICQTYVEKYPINIEYIEKENGGLSSARNVGLDLIKGKYVNFMDPDDTMTKNSFSEVFRFFEANASSVDMVCVPLYYFGAETGLHGKYEGLGNKNRIINLTRNPADFILSSASTFYKAEVFSELRFDERLMTEEDTKLNISIVRRTFQIGYVCEKGVKYNYRKRPNGGSNVDILASGSNFESLMAPVYIFEELMDYSRELAPWEKELVVYELRSRLKVIKKDAFDESDYKKIIDSYSKWIKKLDIEFIAKTQWLETIEKKVLFLNLSGRSFTELTRQGYLSLSDRLVHVMDLYYENKEVHLVCRYNNFCESDFELALVSDDGSVIFASRKIDIDGPFDSVYGEFHVDKTHIRDYVIPYENKQYSLYYIDKKLNSKVRLHRVRVFERSRICSSIKNVGPVFDGFCFSIQDGVLYVSDNWEVITGKNELVSKVNKKNVYYRELNGEKKYILINDRPEKAGDNGEALFYFIMENEIDEIKNNTFFVINRSCDDYKNMNFKDHIIQFRSIEHLEKFINAKVIFSSHQARAFYFPFDEGEYRYYADLLKYKFIWLQHGVTKDNLQKEAGKLNGLNNGIITATKWEKKEFLRAEYLYKPEEILPSGFARFDELHNCAKKIITVAPTWRKELVGKILPNGHNEENDDFINSDFYRNYMNLLTDDELINYLREKGYVLDFVLHSGFTAYEPLFEMINCDVIRLRHMNEFSYKKAFAESSLFITDFSSTAFDFAYLSKPVIYFQFDEDSFFDKHYRKSDWDYRKNGLGPVVNTISELINEIKNSVNSNCILEKEYEKRIEDTFLYRDHNNCKRIMDMTRTMCLEEIPVYDMGASNDLQQRLIEQMDEVSNLQREIIIKTNEISGLKNELSKQENEIKQLCETNDNINYYLSETRKSFSYKLGYLLTFLPRKIRGLIKNE